MSYKIAGIDVHKKVLMVVVIDASTADCEPERRRFATMPSDLRRLLSWLQEKEVKGAVMEIHRAVLAVGLASIGAVYAFAVGTSVFQSCPAGAQTRLQGRRTAGAAADRRRVDLEFRPERRTAYLAQHDANEDATHAGPSALAESDGVSARRNAHQALQCSK